MYKQLSRNFSWMASHRQRCIVEYLSVAYHIREISHRGNNITARNISPVASNKVEERNVSSRLCTLKHSDFFIPHFRRILKLSRHASFRFERVSKLKYAIYFFHWAASISVRSCARAHTHRSMDIFSKGNYFLRSCSFFTVKRFSFESKKKLLSSAGFNNEATGIIPLSPPYSSPSPSVLDREYNYVLRLVNSIFFSLW